MREKRPKGRFDPMRSAEEECRNRDKMREGRFDLMRIAESERGMLGAVASGEAAGTDEGPIRVP